MRHVDVLIVGGGVAGLSCALFTSKAGLSTLVIDNEDSQISDVKQIWNFPGIVEGISGEEWLSAARHQVQKYGGQFLTGQVTSLDVHSPIKKVFLEPNKISTNYEWENPITTTYLVLSVNLGYQLLEDAGFSLAVNEHVPSRKIRYVEGVQYNGRTHITNVYIAGLLAHLPSQTVIASGQGAFVGIQIASQHLGKAFMWHD
ncbi:NAD(P)/FAD-dependent oxidoreductase [Alicyclobacillus tolerans]|uniref:FAD binding domain-containing protein n=2 Tax=Alicyclobacillus tolerans TaxID=90970 RepID=A0A1M6MRK5_9BACL|nr:MULTISPECIES: FAD-dependent oxidoreductase [Alicyclobacillus]MDP9728129.1 thioredoxin reductase [Alicyclobacillus tengchongensis]SHJ85913.1 FAD binding domain-containing protein [Alicyclobacillus montanus]